MSDKRELKLKYVTVSVLLFISLIFTVPQALATHLGTPDGTAPTVVSITPSTILISDSEVGPGTFTVAVVFSEAMDASGVTDPTISFTPDVTLTTLTLAGGGVWSAGNTIYTATYDVVDVEETEPDVDISVSGAEDATGTLQTPSAATDAFDIDTENPTVTSIVPSDTEISDSDATITPFTVVTDFSEDVTGPAVVSFTPGVGSTLTLCGTSVTDANTFTTSCTVADAGVDENAVGISVAGVTDLAGNLQSPDPTTETAQFAIDTENPTKSSTVSDPLISDSDTGSSSISITGDGTFTVTTTFSEFMDTSVAATPVIAFIPSVSTTLSFDSGSWNAVIGTIYTAKYDVLDGGVTIADVDVQVSGAKDLAGNLDPGTTADLFDVDTQNPTGTVSINSAAAATVSNDVTLSLTCNDNGGSGCDTIEISVDGGTIYGTPIASAVSAPATLPAPRGDKTVTVRFTDVAGNVSEDPQASDSIKLDAKITIFSAPSNTAPRWGLDPVSFTGTVTNALDSDQIKIDGDILPTTTATVDITNGQTGTFLGDIIYPSGSFATNTHQPAATLVTGLGVIVNDAANAPVKVNSAGGTVSVVKHISSLDMTINSRFYVGNTFSATGKLFDVSAATQVPVNKNIVFSGSGAFSLPTPSSTNPVRFTDSAPGLEIGLVGGSYVLKATADTLITTPSNPTTVSLFFKNISAAGTVDLEVTPVGSLPELQSIAIDSGDQFLSLAYPTAGIVSIKIVNYPNSGSTTLNILKVETQNKNFDTVHIVDFAAAVLITTSPIVKEPGKYSSVSVLGSTGAKTAIANFAVDVDYLASSTTVGYTVNPVPESASGGIGGAATILSDEGTGISPKSCTVNPAGDTNTSFDNDGDFLCDTWEGAGNGIPIGTSVTEKYVLAGSDPNKKDIYIEGDFMTGNSPDPLATGDVVTAFANSPVTNPSPSTTGIVIHYDPGEALTHVASIGVWVDTDTIKNNDFNSIKNANFGTPSEYVTLGGTYSNSLVVDPAFPTSTTKKLLTVSGITVQTPTSSQTSGVTKGEIVIKTKLTLSPSSTVPTLGAATIPPPGAGLTIISVTPTVSLATTSEIEKTITIKVKFSTSGAIGPVSLGDVKFPFTLGTGQTVSNSNVAQKAGSPTVSSDLITAKAQAYRYVLWAHSIGPCGPSGQAELKGNDMVIALGCNFDASAPEAGLPTLDANGKRNTVGTRQEQSGTFMHEFGHLLNLQHGGPQKLIVASGPLSGSLAAGTVPADTVVNCKPDYPSVMSYSRQIPKFLTVGGGWNLDYSNGYLSGLDESALVETTGLSFTAPAPTIVWGTPDPTATQTFLTGLASAGSFNWNGISSTGTVSADINNLGVIGCLASYPEPGITYPYRDYSDWANLDYNLRATTFGQFDGFYDSETGEAGSAVGQTAALLGSKYFGPNPPPNLADGKGTFQAGETLPVKVTLNKAGLPLTAANTIDPTESPGKLTLWYRDAGKAGQPKPGTTYTKVTCTNSANGNFKFDTVTKFSQCNWKTPGKSQAPSGEIFYLKVIYNNPKLLQSDLVTLRDFILTDDTQRTPTNPHNLPFIDPNLPACTPTLCVNEVTLQVKVKS